MKVVDARNSTAPVAETTAPITRSLFPVDAQAVIYKPARSTMMSAPKRKEEWRMQFERRTPLRIEPLMGFGSATYTLTSVPKGRLDTDPTNVSDLQGARARSV
jgi:ETC complex I subunit conserved region